MHVLAVDSDQAVLNMVRLSLASDGHTVETCTSGEGALEKVPTERFDVMILDVALPGMGGAAVAAAIRESGDTTPIMMLSSTDREDDIIRSFQAGADCYAIKPVSPQEVLARVRALFRRGEFAKDPVLQFHDLTLDQGSQTVHRGGSPVDLTGTEFKLLAALMRGPNGAVSREDLIETVWISRKPSGTRILDAHMANLRRKLQETGPPLIETVHGYGYRLVSHAGELSFGPRAPAAPRAQIDRIS